MKSISKSEGLRFILVGGSSVLIDYFSFLTLLYAVDSSLFFATSISYLLGFVVNFFGHALVTFRVSPKIGTLVRYIITALLNYSLCVLIVFGGMIILQFPELWKLVSFCIIAINGFFICRFWIFRDDNKNIISQK